MFLLFIQVIGVAQVINKDGGKGVFTKEDEEVWFTLPIIMVLPSDLWRRLGLAPYNGWMHRHFYLCSALLLSSFTVTTLPLHSNLICNYLPLLCIVNSLRSNELPIAINYLYHVVCNSLCLCLAMFGTMCHNQQCSVLLSMIVPSGIQYVLDILCSGSDECSNLGSESDAV